ncbi:MAG: NAD kinase [uncultured Solirubrobacteraceae bacterium]|uniref:NAD kinase n=1 Tax=uncultured Solirubrobacteraceae bacterium TaxID=1162706 RepID=A0A6J4TH91_9ACTN|nr:MAG: NAD kinase [uncultured Solirubrobacteraceae bacterium]
MSAAARRSVTVLTHQRIAEVTPTLQRLIACARANGVTLRFDDAETEKHGLRPDTDGVIVAGAPRIGEVELCVVLGGDGTILRGLRCYAGTRVPVFAVNFGEVGFLATIEPEELDEFGFERAIGGEFEVLPLPAIVFRSASGREHKAINDISFHRKIGGRVAQLSYGVQGEEVGSVRCDGLVVCTPAGSTGYNLANGGPVLAWGVEGFGVSFISPHSLTARALVVAPGDILTVTNRGREPVDVNVDGQPVCEVAPGEDIHAAFQPRCASLAQLPGSSFYKRLRAKFGRLSS